MKKKKIQNYMKQHHTNLEGERRRMEESGEEENDAIEN